MTHQPTPQHWRPPIVGIGASAGSAEALKRLFQGLPDDLGAFYLVAQSTPEPEGELSEVLERATRMAVRPLGDGDRHILSPNQVYLVAADRRLEIDGRLIAASRLEPPQGRSAAIDRFLQTLAKVPGDVYAILLSGEGADGAIGARAVRAAGGLVLVQAPAAAAHDGLPRAVIAAGAADLALPIRALAEKLAELVRQRGGALCPGAPDDGQGDFERREETAIQGVLELLRQRTGHDFSTFERYALLRRLSRRMRLNDMREIALYRQHLAGNVEEIQALLNELGISVTRFFCDPESWAALQAQVIEPLVARADPDVPIRCWVPGCATGEEAYTLAILFQEEMERRQVERELVIFATDLNAQALATARDGLYPSLIREDLSEARLQRWLRHGAGGYRVLPSLRRCLVFSSHDLQGDPPFLRLHLIVCRHLLTYLDQARQRPVMAGLRYACRDDGYLALGRAETASAEHFRPLDPEHRLYRPIADSPGHRRAPTDLSVRRRQAPSGMARRVPRSERNTPGEVHRLMLEGHAPPSILVDASGEILHLSETAGRFLRTRGGPVRRKILELVRAELSDAVDVALRHAFEAREPWLSEAVPMRLDGSPRRVGVQASPQGEVGQPPCRALLLFLEGTAVSAESIPPGDARDWALYQRLHRAEQQIEQLSAARQAAEEDLRDANAALRDLSREHSLKAEELETSKEELRSTNEELRVLNMELKANLHDISQARDDLENLMAATDIATLFLGPGLGIKWFTPPLTKIFHLRPHDTGRPIGEVRHRLRYHGLESDARQVLTEHTPLEREVSARDGRAFILRLRPYRTAGNRIDGVVVTLVEVTRLKQAQAALETERASLEERVAARTAELRRSEAALRQLAERLQLATEAGGIGVWEWDVGTERVIWDEQTYRLHGVSPAGFAATYAAWREALHPGDVTAVETDIARAVEAEGRFNQELRIRWPDGAVRWLASLGKIIRESAGQPRRMIGVNWDITERKAHEQQLRIQAEVLANATEGVNVVALDDLSILYANPGFESMLGYAPGELLGRNISLVNAEQDRSPEAVAQSIAEGLRETGVWRGEVLNRRKDGTTFWSYTSIASRELPFLGRVAISAQSDISAMKEAEERLRRSEAQLHALAARLQAVREEERTRLAREVHDVLGQLLTALTMDMAWLRRRSAKVPDLEMRAALTDKLSDMGQLTEGMIRSVQEITSDLRPTVLDNLGLDAAIRFETERFQRRTEIACALETATALPSLTSEQSTGMFRIFQEILTNVARHSGAGRVEIRLREDEGGIRLEVSDDGRGITPAELDDGQSLGLASMRERAAQMRGRLDIQGRPGVGTRVSLRVPV